MRRVVVTGMGSVGPLGPNISETLSSLRKQKSGIVFHPPFAEMGFRGQALALPQVDLSTVPANLRKFMGDGIACAYLATSEAIKLAGLTEADLQTPSTGIIYCSGGPSTAAQVAAVDIARTKGVKRIGVRAVPKCMSSGSSANLASAFKTQGMSLGVTSACSTGTNNIGLAFELIFSGCQNTIIAGACEEWDWTLFGLFDALGALAPCDESNATEVMQPFGTYGSPDEDTRRKGFVPGGGAATLVLENLETAVARGATIYAEVIGFFSNSDGSGDMIQPSEEGITRLLEALSSRTHHHIDYINLHGTGTALGDRTELAAVKKVFPSNDVLLSTTKGLHGHAQGATGAMEAVNTLLMMGHEFVAGSPVRQLMPEAQDLNLVTKPADAAIHTAISCNYGFGVTNAGLVFTQYNGC